MKILLKSSKLDLIEIEKEFKKDIDLKKKKKRYKFSLTGTSQKMILEFILNRHEAKITASQGEKINYIFFKIRK